MLDDIVIELNDTIVRHSKKSFYDRSTVNSIISVHALLKNINDVAIVKRYVEVYKTTPHQVAISYAKKGLL